MATVTQILDRASKVTSLKATGDERTIALQSLQNAYRRAVSDAEIPAVPVSYTFVSAADYYSLSTILGVEAVKLLHVSLQSGGGRMLLDQTGIQELLDNRNVQEAVGTPCLYATIGFDRIAFYPNPAVGDIVQIWYVADTPTLVETSPGAGEESTPSKIPTRYHWDVLLAGTVLEMLDKDQRSDDVKFWMQRYENGIIRMKIDMGEMGGDANRYYLSPSEGRTPFRDERSR